MKKVYVTELEQFLTFNCSEFFDEPIQTYIKQY